MVRAITSQSDAQVSLKPQAEDADRQSAGCREMQCDGDGECNDSKGTTWPSAMRLAFITTPNRPRPTSAAMCQTATGQVPEPVFVLAAQVGAAGASGRRFVPLAQTDANTSSERHLVRTCMGHEEIRVHAS